MRNNGSWQKEYMSRFYDRSKGWMDGTSEFHTLCTQQLRANSGILEVGAGPSNQTSRFLATRGRLFGIDIDAAVKSNEFLEEAYVIIDDRYPFPNLTFDACISDCVLEHVQHVDAHLREVFRVLRPGGVYVFRTPNRFRYVTLVAKYSPTWFHEIIANRLRTLPETSHDPYPTYYYLNSKRSIVRATQRNGFTLDVLRLIEKEPSYGMSSRALFMSFLAYERIVNSYQGLENFRASILAVLTRPESSQEA